MVLSKYSRFYLLLICVFKGKRSDRETEIKRFFFKLVFLCQLRAAGVGADAAHLIVDAENGVRTLFQFVVVRFTGQLLGGVAGSVEAEVIGGDEESGLLVADGQVAATVMASVFLRLT